MSVHTPDAVLTGHAKRAFIRRQDSDVRLPSSSEIETAWKESIPIGAEGVDGKARLHPPTNTLFVHKYGTVKTVLRFKERGVNDDHLKVCEDCGQRYWPVIDDECNWCSSPATEQVWTNGEHDNE